MEIIRLVEAKVLSMAENILEVIEEGNDYLSFEAELKKELDNLGSEILKTVLEELDEKIHKSKERKREWEVVRRKEQKGILTPFGLVNYERSYYRHKQTKQYRHLVDQKVSISPHARVGRTLKAELSEASSTQSYESSTLQVSRYNQELKVSKQTVLQCVREFKAKGLPEAEKKRHVPMLYIEADEDHLRIKKKRKGQARLIYVHEGVIEKPRRQLKNARHFTTVNKTTEEFWMEVCDYIEEQYELESLEAIYLSGDGGAWIKAGQEYIPGVTFILDKFHLYKYILTATAHAPELKRAIYSGIRKTDKEEVIKQLQEARERALEKPRQKRILDTINYIQNNWDGIESQIKNPHVGCSAEGHVSHILASRMSSRPMAWSKQGAENMASMRAVRANGESIKKHYLSLWSESSPIIELKTEVQKELRKLRKRHNVGKETTNNVPLFHGVDNLTRTAIKGLNAQFVI